MLDQLEAAATSGPMPGEEATRWQRCRRLLLPVGDAGVTVIVRCWWVIALVIALFAATRTGPFSTTARDTMLMLAVEGLLGVVALVGVSVAKICHRVHLAQLGAMGPMPGRHRSRPLA